MKDRGRPSEVIGSLGHSENLPVRRAHEWSAERQDYEDAWTARSFNEYVRELEAGLTPEERATLDTFRDHYRGVLTDIYERTREAHGETPEQRLHKIECIAEEALGDLGPEIDPYFGRPKGELDALARKQVRPDDQSLCRYCAEDADGLDAMGRPACERHIEEVADDLGIA